MISEKIFEEAGVENRSKKKEAEYYEHWLKEWNQRTNQLLLSKHQKEKCVI